MAETDELYYLRGGESWRSPFEAYRRLRDESPAHRVEHPDYGEFWVLSRFDDVFNAARDTETFSSAQGLTPDVDAMAMFEDQAAPIVMMDPPVHTAMRRLVSRPMTPRRVAPIEPAIAEFVDARLDAVAGRGHAAVDIIDTLFKPLPSFVVSHYLGVPVQDRERFDRWTSVIVAANAGGDFDDAAATFLELFTYAGELIERRRAEPGDDLVSDLVGASDEVSIEWIVGFIFTMVAGGNDTTTGLLGGAAELLTANPDQRQVLLDDPSLVRPAINEFLRLTSPVQNLARTTTRPVMLHDQEIPEGVKVMLVYGAANRDERQFGDDAEQLHVTRNPDKMLALGYGAHHCLGAAAARLQTAIALERLLARFPDFEVDAAAGQTIFDEMSALRGG